MKARDVMTTGPHTIGPDATITEAARLMLEQRISALPVVGQSGKLIGIVSEGDLIRRVEIETAHTSSRWRTLFSSEVALAADYVKSHARRVRDVMTQSVITVTEDTPLVDIADLMEQHRIKRIPIERDDVLVGVVSRADLLKALVERCAMAAPAEPTDQAIGEQVIAELNRQPWGFMGAGRVTVADGVVHLWGTVLSERERRAARVAAEGVRGVKDVIDHLTWEIRVPAIG